MPYQLNLNQMLNITASQPVGNKHNYQLANLIKTLLSNSKHHFIIHQLKETNDKIKINATNESDIMLQLTLSMLVMYDGVTKFEVNSTIINQLKSYHIKDTCFGERDIQYCIESKIKPKLD